MLSGLLGPHINCSTCGKNFRPNLRDEEQTAGKLRLFTCPHCHTDYPVALIRPDGRVEDRRGAH